MSSRQTLRARLRAGFEAAAPPGAAGPEREAWLDWLEAGFVDRQDRLALGDDDLLELAERADYEGLRLAGAAELGDEAAWCTLVEEHREALLKTLQWQGESPARAGELVDAFFGDLALPPAHGRTRTRIGTYLGACSLRGWLRSVIKRRAVDAHRRRRRDGLPLESAAEPADRRADPAARSGEAPPPAAAAVLREAWAALTAREQQAAALSFRDGVGNSEIARLLGVGKPRVTRLLQSAVKRLAEHFQRAGLEAESGEGEMSWDRWRALVGIHLATLGDSGRREGEAGEEARSGASDGSGT